MLALFLCSSGHRWEAPPAAPPGECPQCGLPPVPAGGGTTGDPEPGGEGDPAEAPTVPPWAAAAAGAPERPRLPGYEILGELGQGGMGIVYRAWQRSLNRNVALKMLYRQGPDDASGEADRARFRVEAEAVARLDHPHIIHIHDFFEHAGRLFFSMELVEGANLADRLAGGPLAPAEAAALVEVLARAVHYAHQREVVHRDLKPRNILLAHGGPGPAGAGPFIPKVADFGLAKRLDRGSGPTLSGAIMGTPSYMAPEQAEGRKDVGPAADVWALGAILYEALTGQPAFRGEKWFDTLEQVRTRDPAAPSRLRPGLPAELDGVCLKCLEKEARDRYDSAAALAEDLRRFQAGETLTIRPLSEWEREMRWARRAGYEIEEVIGSSLLGMVYRARERDLPRRVALKTISARAQLDLNQLHEPGDQETRLWELQEVQDRFRAEAQVAAQLEHPHIVRVYHLGEYQGQSYLATEFLDGGTLADRLTGEPFPLRQAAQLVETLARATYYAHQLGIIHSDLRPFNVLMTAPDPGADGRDSLGTAKITGFGLARLLGNRPGETPVRGARRVFSSYMAPEQAAGRAEDVGPTTDVHALGAILYHMLTGQAPFVARTVRRTLERIRTEVPRAPRDLVPDLPPRLEAICLRCLEKESARRYPGALELADDLRRYLQMTEDFELVPGYEIGDELGRGGIGLVYRARQTTGLLRWVALKVYREHTDHILAANRAVAGLDHPSIVRIHDCGEREGMLYVAEELVEGGSLARRIAESPLAPADAARLACTLARALHFLHERGIIHANLKPKVVLLTAEGPPRISGFDLARLAEREPGEAGEVGLRGTPAYMAPEQAKGLTEMIGPATDVHGLGLLLYEMLTGCPAFYALNVLETLQQVSQRDPVPVGELRPEVPAALQAICMKCLRKDPAQRYPGAEALADDLDRFLNRPWQRVLGWLGIRGR